MLEILRRPITTDGYCISIKKRKIIFTYNIYNTPHLLRTLKALTYVAEEEGEGEVVMFSVAQRVKQYAVILVIQQGLDDSLLLQYKEVTQRCKGDDCKTQVVTVHLEAVYLSLP